jgi:nitrogenase molybdenum-iron protein alpha chain
MTLINLKNSNIQAREHRLGSIVSYEGSASDLAQKSRTGSLQDRPRSFTQVSSCSSSCAICLLSLIQDAAVVNHAPLGCAADFSMFNLTNRFGQVKRGLTSANAHLVSSNLTESDAVFGGSAKLEQALRDAHARFNPKALFVTASCASAITGEDIDAVADRLETELGIPIAVVHCEGFRSKVWTTGFDVAYHAILRKIVKPPRTKHPELVNVITFWGEDVFTELFGKLGLIPNLIVPFSNIEQLSHLSESAATVQMCSTLGTYLAAGLESLYGVPEVKAPPPYGMAGADAWLRALGRTVGKETEVEALIVSEREAIAPALAELRKELKGLTGYVAAGSVHGHSTAAILAELGMKVVGSCFWHHDPKFDNQDAAADSLQHLVENYGDIPVSICNKQTYEVVNQLRRLKPDVFIVRHPGMAVWGGKLGIPTFLVEDEHFGLGYRGLLRYGRKIADAVNNPAFFQHLAQHTRVPYTDWWLRQGSFTFLGAEE